MNRVTNLFRLSSVALLLASSTTLSAQAAGQLTGTVTKTDGSPIAGATVIIRAPQLIAPRTFKTDATGQYRFALLPPGDYTLTVSADSYITAKNQTPLRIGLGAQLKQDFQLRGLETASATVAVVASNAVVDKSDPKTSVNFSADQLAALPSVNRSFEGALDLTPGAAAGPAGVGTATIRGGKQQTAVYTINGTTVGEDIAGVSPNSGTTFFVDDAIEDTEVVVSGLHGRYGRTSGGSINVATKSGGNDFSGSIRKYISRNDWGALRPGRIGNGSLVTNEYANRNTDIVVSGPIWKDKIWFVASTTITPTVGTPITIGQGGLDATQWTMYDDPSYYGPTWLNPAAAPAHPLGKGDLTGFDLDKGIVISSQTSAKFYQGKLTWAITPEHIVAIERSYNQVKTRNAGFNGGILMASRQSYTSDDPTANSYNAFLYKGTLSNSVFVEAHLSEKTYTHLNGPQVPYPHVRYYADGMEEGMAWPYGTNVNALKIENNANKTGAVNVKWVTDWKGQHEIDFGYQYYESLHYTSGICGPNQERFYVYGATENPTLLAAANMTQRDIFGRLVGFLALNWRDVSGHPDASWMTPGVAGIAPSYRKYVGIDGAHRNRNEGIYITDVWQASKNWTILAALRMERVRDTDTDGSVFIRFNSPISPRFKVTYDVNGDSGHVFSLSAAKFTEDITAGTTAQFVSSPGNAFINYGWNANPANKITWVSMQQLTNPANFDRTLPLSQVSNSAGVVGMKDLSSPYIMEYTGSYRRTRRSGSYVGFNLVYKKWHNDFVQAFNAYDTATYARIQLDPSLNPSYTLANRVFNSKDLQREYKAFEMDFREVASERLTFGGNYTYSRLVGNDDGGDSFGYPFKTNSVSQSAVTWATQYYTFRDAILANGWKTEQYAPSGLLIADQTHKARLFVSYRMPLGKDGHISYSLAAKYDSGFSWSARSGNTTSGEAASKLSVWANPALKPTGTGIPSQVGAATMVYYSSARGAFHAPDTHGVDFRLDFLAPLGFWRFKLMGNIQITNVFNKIMLASYDNNMQNASAGTSPTNLTVVRPKVVQSFGMGDTYKSGSLVNSPGFYNFGRNWTASIGVKF